MTEQHRGNAKSPHAYMAEALGVQARLLEQRRTFLRAALSAEQHALESTRGYFASEVDAYFDARAAEQIARLPGLRPWRS